MMAYTLPRLMPLIRWDKKVIEIHLVLSACDARQQLTAARARFKSAVRAFFVKIVSRCLASQACRFLRIKATKRKEIPPSSADLPACCIGNRDSAG